MKKLLFLFLLLPFFGISQSKLYFRADTSLFYKVGGYNEVAIENSTKDTLGYLYNYGNGRTRFDKPRSVNGGIKFGSDTLYVDINASNGLTYDNTTRLLTLGGTLTATTTIAGAGFQFHLDGMDGVWVDKYININGMKLWNGTNVTNGNTWLGANPPSNARSANTVVGYNALNDINNSSASENVAIGTNAMTANLTGGSNVAIGYGAMNVGTTPNQSVAVGKGALSNNNALYNVGVGYNALTSNTTGTKGVAVGHSALQSNTTGIDNTAIGDHAMQLNTSGEQNTAIGTNALYVNTTGIKNTAIGAGVLESNTTGSFNYGFGHDVMLGLTDGYRNIGIGWNALSSTTSSYQNIAFGYAVGALFKYGHDNVFIGPFGTANVSGQLDTVNHSIAVGSYSKTTASNQMQLGSDSIFEALLYGELTLPAYSNARPVDADTDSAFYRGPNGEVLYGKVNGGGGSSGGFFTPNQTNTTGTTTHDANYNIFNLWNLGRLFITAGTNGNSSEFFQDSVVISYGVVDNTTSHSSVIQVRADSIEILPSLGLINIDTLDTWHGSDTANFKPTVYNASTGQFKQFTYWPGSGGGGTPGGSNTQLQYNNSSSFGGISGATSDGTNLFVPTLYGSSAANGDIVIEGTTSGTKTSSYVNLQPTSGNVGIGTSTPGMKLDVVGGSIRTNGNLYVGDGTTTYSGYVGVILKETSSHSLLDFWDNGSRVGEFYTDASSFNFFTDAGKDLKFYTDNDFSLPLIYGGTNQRVGINKTSPSFTLHVGGAIGGDAHIDLAEVPAPSTPSSGRVVIYAKSDGLWYGKDDLGVETKLSNSDVFATADNGLTANTATNIRLGGTLATATTIATAGNTLTISTSTGAINPLAVSSTTGNAAEISATTGYALRAFNTGSTAALAALKNSTSTNTLISTLSIDRLVSGGSGAAGAGSSIDFNIEIADGSTPGVARIAVVTTDATAGAYAGKLTIYTSIAGAQAVALEVDERKSLILYGREQKKQGADVASAAGAITLGTDGNSFEITGTAAITLISNVNWQNGSEVTLLFTSTATLTDGTANSGTDIGMELAGNINFSASAGSTLTLVLSEIGGTQRWREKNRSVN